MRYSSLIRALFFWGVGLFAFGMHAGLWADWPEATPNYVVIDLGPQMTSPVKITDANVVLGHDFHSAWFSWSEGTLTPLRRDETPAGSAPVLQIKLPQPPGAAIVPLKKVDNVPTLRDHKGMTAAQKGTTHVIGNGPDGAYVWEKENGPDKKFGGPLPLNLLITQDSVRLPWNITSVTDINNGGAMVGSAIYTRIDRTDPILPGPHGVLILPMAIVEEITPRSGDFGPLADNGLDNKSVLATYATPGKGQTETDKSDVFTANIYGGLDGPFRATMIFTLTTRFGTSDTGTLSESAAGSGVFVNRTTHARAEIQPLDQTPTGSGFLNVLVSNPKLNITGDTHFLHQTGPTSSKYEDDPFPLDVILKAPLSTSAINTLWMGLGGVGGAPNEALTETAINSRVFRSADGLAIAISDYQASPGGALTVKLVDPSLTRTRIQFTLRETSPTSLLYSNFVRTITDVPPSTPATDGEGIFYVEMTGTHPMKVTVVSGPSHVTVEAVPVKGRPNLLRTGKLVMIETGDPFRAPGITTIESGGEEIDLQMEGQTIVK